MGAQNKASKKIKPIKVAYQAIPDINNLHHWQTWFPNAKIPDWLGSIYVLSAFTHAPGQAISRKQLKSYDENKRLIEESSQSILNKIPDDELRYVYNHVTFLKNEYYHQIQQKQFSHSTANNQAFVTSNALDQKSQKKKKLEAKRAAFNIFRWLGLLGLAALTFTSMIAFIALTIAGSLLPPAFPALLIFSSAVVFTGLAATTCIGLVASSAFDHFAYKKPIKKLKSEIYDTRIKLQDLKKHVVKPLLFEAHKLYLVGAILESLAQKLSEKLSSILTSTPAPDFTLFQSYKKQLPSLYPDVQVVQSEGGDNLEELGAKQKTPLLKKRGFEMV